MDVRALKNLECLEDVGCTLCVYRTQDNRQMCLVESTHVELIFKSSGKEYV